jgi:hypothetical protein
MLSGVWTLFILTMMPDSVASTSCEVASNLQNRRSFYWWTMFRVMPCHVSEVALRLLRDAKVRVIPWLPHRAQIFQQLEIALFGVLKQRGPSKLPFDDEQGIANFLFRIYRRFKQTMIETNIWRAFQEAGFYFDMSVEPCRIRFDEEKLRRTAPFQEIWVLAVPPGKRRLRSRAAKFGWISKPESIWLVILNLNFPGRWSRYIESKNLEKLHIRLSAGCCYFFLQ